MKTDHLRLSQPGWSRGFSLIELMISMALSLIILIAMGYVFLGTHSTFKQQDALGRLQENARFVFETIANDIRMVGYAGSLCGMADTEVVNSIGADWDVDIFDNPLMGYENAADTAPDISDDVYSESASDALVILHADTTKEYIIDADAAAGAEFSFSGDEPEDGNVVLSGCANAVSPANTAIKPRAAFALSGGINASTLTVASQSTLIPLKASLYYIRVNGSGVPAFYRKPGAADAEELAEGVEDMQILYGVDTSSCASSANDGGVDAYVSADDIEDTVPCVAVVDDWKRVLAVRVTLSMRSVRDNVTTETQAAGDRRLHKTFTTTIAVRNRL